MATDQELLEVGVAPEAVATLAADRPIFEARQAQDALDKIAPIISEAEALDKLAPIVPAPDESAQLDAIAPVVDPLDIFSDEALISDISFSPKEHYIQKGGAVAFDAKAAARLGRIRKGQEAGRSVLGTAAAQVKEIIPQVASVIKGVGKGIASGLNVFTAPAVAAVTSNELGVEYSNLVEQQAAESLHGVVAETAGLAKGVGSLGKYISRKTGLSKDWSDMTDEEAFRAIIDEGEKEREVRSMSQGNIPALAPTRERLAEEGFPVRPEKVQEATEMGTLGWLAFGTALKLGGAGVSKVASGAGKLVPESVLSAAQKAEQLAALRVAKDAALAAQKAGPKNAATEAALRTAQENFQAAEAAVGESNLAGAIDLVGRARASISSVSETVGQEIIGRPIQAAGAVVEGLTKMAKAAVSGPFRALGTIGGLFYNPVATIAGVVGRDVAAPIIQRAGAAAKGYGKAVAEGQARRTLDVLGAAKDVATTSLSQYPLDYAFSIGLSDTDQEARVSAPISTALGVFPGARRGISRIVTGELITPKGAPTFRQSPAYGENKTLDATHATAMKAVDAKSAAQVNWVRELARKMGGRVYLMPDTATFESALGEVWKLQNPGAEITPAIAAQLKQAADQQGMAWGEFRATDGELQPTVFIKNPEAAIHEMGHILEKVLPEQVNARLDAQILNRLSPENIEAAGAYYVRRLGETGNWREVFQRLNPELTPEQYLARELRAENLGVLLKNRGEAFATSPGIYRWLAQTVAKIGDVQGIPLAQSEALGFPVFGDVMRASEKAAGKILSDEAGQELIQARDARLKVATPTEVKQWSKLPETPAEGAAEADKVEAWLQTASIPVASRAAAAATLVEAMRNQQGVRLSYWGAKGEPGGDPAALRPERRAEIEAQRDAPNADRPLVTKDYFPYGAIITSKGPQFKGWSPNNFNANVARFTEWLTANPAAASRIPLAHDLATEAGQRGLQADLQTFIQNQQAGFTGSGRELIIPPESGAVQPAKTGVQPVSIPQERADAISYLFNLKLPETPRVTSGKLPLNIVGQMVSETTLPGRVTEPVRPRGAFIGPKAEALNIAGETIREVNPFRQTVEQAAKDAGTKPPELIEAAQILALDRIADATVAPELPAFGGNVVTLTAGFLPDVGREWKITGQRGGIRSETTVRALDETTARKLATAQGFRVEKASPIPSPQGALGQFLPVAKELDGIKVAAIRSSDGKIYTGSWHGEAVMNYIDAIGKGEAGPVRKATEFEPAYDEGFLTQSGRFLNREEAATHARRIGQMPEARGELENDSFRRAQQFLPGDTRAQGEEILRMTPEEFSTATRGWEGGLTGEARKIGLGLTSPEELASLRQFSTEAQASSKAAMARKDFDTAMAEVGKVQMFNEAIQSATGTGSNGEALRAALGADYQPPFPEGGAEATIQALPKETFREKIDKISEKIGDTIFRFGDTKAIEKIEGALQQLDDSAAMQKVGDALFETKDRIDEKITGQFLPKKGKDEFKLLPAGATGSKAWVLPGGKVEQLGAQWHHDWLDQNKAVQEKYGLEVPPFEGGDAEGVREQALKKGFVRVNYSRNTGTLTVEARAKDWRKQKGAVERLIEENLDDIDNVTVHLMDESVQKVVDSASERLFNYDEDVQKMANLPFITKGEVRGGAQFLPSENKVFNDELKKIRGGESGGQTFNSDGSVWQAPETPSDIVTLASVNIPREKLTAAEFEKATAPYQELLAQPNIAAGVFAFEQGGKPSASIDINAVVPQSFRDNTLAFAKANDQVAIWDAAKNETVEAGGSGNTKITSPEQMRAAAESLAAGEPFQFLPAEQTGLPGISTGREFDRKAIEGMSQAQLKEYFPEAVIPKKNTEYLPSAIADSPLAKAAGNKEAAVQAFADKLVQFYRQREDTPGSQAGAKWYSEFTPLLKKEFGKDSRIFAELLAATSPNNTPKVNFAFALDAFQNWKAGKYDKMITKFNEGLNKLSDGGLEKVYQRDLKAGNVKKPPEKPSEATYLAHWIDKNNLIPMGSSGKRFSMHSVPVLKVLARKWLELNTGLKTDNFIKNLVGEGDEATVDVWADRTMRRLGYEGFKDRWRILPRNKAPVRDADFIFSQEAFRKAAEELNMKPSALQGALWFAEKQYWNEQGWARLDLGDYKSELERMPQLRAGFRSREASAKAEAKAGQTEQLEILPRQALPAENAQLSVAHRVTSRGASGLGGIGGSYAADGPDEKELEISPR